MNVIDVVERQFGKEFKFCKPVQLKSLPPFDTWFTNEKWQDLETIKMRDELNGVKGLLDDKPLKIWHKHTRRQNPAGYVISQVRDHAHPELLTQAWCKMTECLTKFKLVEDFLDEKVFVSAHLCEAPGAFVTALNHYLKTQCNRPESRWEWTASTLNPYYEGNTTSTMINDDRFILHTIDHWHFGVDDTGNIFSRKNLDGLADKLKKHGGAHFVTADGSIDCQSDPARQESIVAPLHFAEIVAAVSCLRKGGHFVLKMFTMFESESICSMYLLTKLFGSVDVFKPATSKEGNSEVYVICRNFNASVNDDVVTKLFSGIDSDRQLFGKSDLPDHFLDQIRACARYFKNIQVDVIERNVARFEANTDGESSHHLLHLIREMVAGEFLTRYQIQPLKQEDRILPDVAEQSANQCMQVKRKTEEGTFSEKAIVADETAVTLKDKLFGLHSSRTKKVEWILTPDISTKQPKIKVGKKLNQLQSSKFCTTEAIQIFNKVVNFISTSSSGTSYEGNVRKRRRIHSGVRIIVSLDKAEICGDKLLEQITYLYPKIKSSTRILDVGVSNQTFFNEILNPVFFLRLIDSLLDSQNALDQGNHLIIVGFPLLTRKFVGLLRLFGLLFEEIGFVSPVRGADGRDEDGRDAVYFYAFREFEIAIDSALTEIRHASLKETVDVESIVEIFPITDLVVEPLYSRIFAHNTNVIKSKASYLLEQVGICNTEHEEV